MPKAPGKKKKKVYPPPPPEASLLGKQIQRLRTARNLTQEDVAHRANMDRAYYASIEVGMRNPALKNLAKIAHALGVKLSELFQNV